MMMMMVQYQLDRIDDDPNIFCVFFWLQQLTVSTTLLIQVKKLCKGKSTCEIKPTFAMFGVSRKSFKFSIKCNILTSNEIFWHQVKYLSTMWDVWRKQTFGINMFCYHQSIRATCYCSAFFSQMQFVATRWAANNCFQCRWPAALHIRNLGCGSPTAAHPEVFLFKI